MHMQLERMVHITSFGFLQLLCMRISCFDSWQLFKLYISSLGLQRLSRVQIGILGSWELIRVQMSRFGF
jgi:hypothetical protein